MNKKLLILFILTLLTVWPSIGQDLPTNTTENSAIEKAETIKLMPSEKQPLLWNFQVRFCDPNDPTTLLPSPLNLKVGQLEETELCIRVDNYSDFDWSVDIQFVDKTENDQWWLSCWLSSTKTKNFLFPTREWKLKVPAQNQLIKKVKVQFPIWIMWNIESCMWYIIKEEVLEWDLENWGWFKVWAQTRIVKDMQFFVGNAENIKTKILINDISSHINEVGNAVLWLTIYNSWNVSSSFAISWNISNMFGFRSDFLITGWELAQGLDQILVTELWQIPQYKWLFNVDIEITSTPKFSFDINWLDLDKDILKSSTTKANTTLFEMPRTYVGWIIFVIFLLFFAFRKKKPAQVVYVQQPQQPMPPVQ